MSTTYIFSISVPSEAGAATPSLSSPVRYGLTPGPALDAVDQMLGIAPATLTAVELSRIVVTLADRTSLRMADVRRLAVCVAPYAADFDCDLPIATQLARSTSKTPHPAGAPSLGEPIAPVAVGADVNGERLAAAGVLAEPEKLGAMGVPHDSETTHQAPETDDHQEEHEVRP